MKVYRPTFTEKLTGKKKKCSHWYITFVDNLQIRRRLPAFADKRATDRAAVNLDKLLSSGDNLTPELQRWLEKEIPVGMRERLVEWRIIDSRRMSSHLGKSLAAHVEDFRLALEAKGNGTDYVRQETATLNKIFTACGFRVWSDLDANRVYAYLASLRGAQGISERTFNAHLKGAQHFCRWMVQEQRAGFSPLAHLRSVVQTEFRRQRRALDLEEQRRLLAATAKGPIHHGMTGAERSLVYLLALETGLRVGEIAKLTRAAFDFDACTVSLPSAYTKNKRAAEIDLKPATVALLRAHLADKPPHALAFAMNNRCAEMLRPDLEAAGIPYRDDAGRAADFHALRHSFITGLARAGVHPTDMQALARHRSIGMTMRYCALSVRPLLKRIILEQPDLTAAPKNLTVACLGLVSA